MSARSLIIAALRSTSCRQLNFQTGAVNINAPAYGTIAMCVENRQIQVVLSSVFPSTHAMYHKAFNCFVTGNSPSQNLIIHEATHAINDWYRRSIQDVDDEVSAYLAQMIFLFSQNLSLQRSMIQPQVVSNTRQVMALCRTDERYCNSAALGLAAGIAINFLSGGRIDRGTLRPLWDALNRDPDTHRNPASTLRSYNGISRTGIPEAMLRDYQGTIVEN